MVDDVICCPSRRHISKTKQILNEFVVVVVVVFSLTNALNINFSLLPTTFFLQPVNLYSYLHSLISLARSTPSSSVVTLSRPPTVSSLKVTDRTLRYALPRLWNQLPDSLRQPSQSCLDSSLSFLNSSLSSATLSSSITHSLFHSRLKNLAFQRILLTLTFLLWAYSLDCVERGGGSRVALSTATKYPHAL